MRSPLVYDKAKYHSDGDFPDDLPASQAFVHTGLYFGWLLEAQLLSEEFTRETKELLTEFLARRLTGPQVFEACDGCLVDDMLSAAGNAFTTAYFDFEKGRFLADYEAALAANLPTMYHVTDSWENFEKLKQILNRRFAEWKKSPESVRTESTQPSPQPTEEPRAKSAAPESASGSAFPGFATPFTTIVVAGHSRAHLLWELATWSEVVRDLSPIVSLLSHPLSIRTTQAAPKEKAQPRFGRLGWNEQSHRKWTHGPHLPESAHWSFYSTEIWSPSWSVCAKAQRAPDLFLTIANPFIFTASTPADSQFNQLFQISLPTTVFRKSQTLIDPALRGISECIEASLVASTETPWLAKGDSVQDCLTNRVAYSGARSDQILQLTKMKGLWRVHALP